VDTSRSGFGKFECPDRASARSDARFRFLAAIRHDAPHLEDLADEPLALLRVHFCGADPSDVLGNIELLNQAVWSWPTIAKFAEMHSCQKAIAFYVTDCRLGAGAGTWKPTGA
jgi:hypothetical protein